jgi:hypothetical protein
MTRRVHLPDCAPLERLFIMNARKTTPCRRKRRRGWPAWSVAVLILLTAIIVWMAAWLAAGAGG